MHFLLWSELGTKKQCLLFLIWIKKLFFFIDRSWSWSKKCSFFLSGSTWCPLVFDLDQKYLPFFHPDKKMVVYFIQSFYCSRSKKNSFLFYPDKKNIPVFASHDIYSGNGTQVFPFGPGAWRKRWKRHAPLFWIFAFKNYCHQLLRCKQSYFSQSIGQARGSLVWGRKCHCNPFADPSIWSGRSLDGLSGRSRII